MVNRSTPCTLSHKNTLPHKNLAKIHCFMITLKGVLPHDTLSHNFLINYNTLSHNFNQKRTPCRIIFTVKEHPVERHIPSSQVWEYPPPGMNINVASAVLKFNSNDEAQIALKHLGTLEIGMGDYQPSSPLENGLNISFPDRFALGICSLAP